jgi:hypothetical protein
MLFKKKKEMKFAGYITQLKKCFKKIVFQLIGALYVIQKINLNHHLYLKVRKNHIEISSCPYLRDKAFIECGIVGAFQKIGKD